MNKKGAQALSFQLLPPVHLVFIASQLSTVDFGDKGSLLGPSHLVHGSYIGIMGSNLGHFVTFWLAYLKTTAEKVFKEEYGAM